MTRSMIKPWALFVTCLGLAVPAYSEGFFGATGTGNRVGIGSPFEQAFGDCGSPCVVRDNHGGKLYTFFLASEEILSKQIDMVIDGPCYSACASIADRVRKHVCITQNAVFGFHLRHETMMVENEPITVKIGNGRAAEQPLSNDIRAWVLRHGGFPASPGRHTLMYAKDAAQFWRRCSQ